jgi:hypothetical protein
MLARDQAGRLQPAAAPAKEQEEDDDQQDEAETAATVVADARAHVVTAPAGKHKKNN